MINQKASTCAVEVANNIIPLEKSENALASESASKFKSKAKQADNKPFLLSPREQEIVRLVAKGLPNKTIAAILDISPWTVATHLRRVFGKLGVRSRAAMIASLFDSLH